MQRALAKIDELAPGEANAITRAKLRGLLRGYSARWASDSFEILEIEETQSSDLYNPTTSARSRSFTVAGKKDVLLRDEGRLWLMDHKTTSEDISDPDAAYWRQLAVEGQHYHYALLEFCQGKKADGAIWDVVRKPGISPRQIVKADLSEVLYDCCYFGDPVTPDDAIEIRSTGRETPAMYEARLAWDCIESRPGWYFQRRRIAARDDALLEYAGELWGHSQDILLARRLNAWPRNSGACLLYGQPCKFLGICSGYDEPDSANWKRRSWVHPELPSLEGDSGAAGRDVLTNSRVRCFQTCRRKHLYQYEMGLVRIEDVDSEALIFGRLWHEALEVLWRNRKAEYDNANGEQVNAVCCANPVED
jgi:hypothetical protein